MKKLMFYIYSLNKGGAERVLLTLCQELAKEYEIVILTDHRDNREYELPKDVRRIVIDENGSGNYFWRLKQIRLNVKQENPDTFITFMLSSVIRAVFANMFGGKRTIAAIRSNPYDDYGNFFKRLWVNVIFTITDKIICQTEYQKNFFYKGNQRKCNVIFNPIKEEFIKRTEKRNPDGRIVSVGRLFDYKNHLMLMKAFIPLLQKYPNSTVVIYGDGPYRGDLEKFIIQNNLKNRVLLPGDVDDVINCIQNASIFVLPSNTEGMPNALMEAMALGIPCIATDCPCGGPATLIQDGINGYLVKVNDNHSLSQKIDFLLSDVEQAEKVGKKATFIRDNCSVEKIVSEWKKVIS